MLNADPVAGRKHVKALLASRIAHIEGWTYVDEVWALHEITRWHPGRQPITVVEIGSWKGRSTVGLAMATLERGTGQVFAVDPHMGSPECERAGARGVVDTFPEFVANLTGACVDGVVVPIRARSHEARSRFADGSVDVLFIDGSHEYEDVKTDIKDWTSALAEGGVVGFNDPLWPGVYRALRELVLVKDSPYRHPAHVANTLFLAVTRERPWTWRDSLVNSWVRLLLTLRYRVQTPASHLPGWAVGAGRVIYRHLVPSSRLHT